MNAAPTTAAPAIDARGIYVRYGGVPALAGVNLALRAGEVHALVGENGAGKSTLMKVLAGAVRPDAGTLEVGGSPVQFRSPRDAHAAGVRMVHQELRLVPALSAADNIALGREPHARGSHRWRRRIPWAPHVVDRRAARSLARRALERLGAAGGAIHVGTPVAALSLAERQLVEIAKALADGFADDVPARVLILDEPTAVLSLRECDALFAAIEHLTTSGVGVLYITHRLDEVERLAQCVTVLRDGARVAHGPTADFPRDTLIHHMVGRSAPAVSTSVPPSASPPPPTPLPTAVTVLRVQHLVAPGVRDVTFSVNAGEILGLVGLVGAGRTEVARAIIGAAPVTGGTMYLLDRPYAPRSPADAVRAGVGYIPEDRAASALILGASLRVNLVLPSLADVARAGVVIDTTRERGLARAWVNRLAIRTPSIETPVNRLSGGTQQKIVLARWLARRTTLLIADEPTRGVDVGARAEIYRALRRAATEGAGVLVITSELEEALTLCDRLLVMREGCVAGELTGDDRSAHRVGALMVPV